MPKGKKFTAAEKHFQNKEEKLRKEIKESNNINDKLRKELNSLKKRK